MPEQPGQPRALPTTDQRHAALSLGIAVAVVLFGLSVRGRPLPVPIAVFCISAATALMCAVILTPRGIGSVVGELRPSSRLYGCLLSALALGLLLAMYLRWARSETLLPSRLAWFALVAAAIGIVEELIFRGFVQGGLFTRRGVLAIVAAAALHTAYKLSLFVVPAAGEHVSPVILGLGTLAGGMVFGALRPLSGSLWPCLVAHALFDVIAYGDRTAAPSWVWH